MVACVVVVGLVVGWGGACVVGGSGADVVGGNVGLGVRGCTTG